MDGYNFAKLYNEALLNDNPASTLTFTDAELQKFKDQSDPLFYPNTDWLKLVMKEYTPQMQHNVNINGGTKIAKYFVSLGYLNQDGLIKEFQSASGISNNNTYNRYNFRSNVDINVTPTTLVNFQLGGYSSVRHSSKGTESSTGSLQIFNRLLDSAPTATVGIWEGKLITLDRSGVGRNAIAETLATGFVDYMDNSLNINLGYQSNTRHDHQGVIGKGERLLMITSMTGGGYIRQKCGDLYAA